MRQRVCDRQTPWACARQGKWIAEDATKLMLLTCVANGKWAALCFLRSFNSGEFSSDALYELSSILPENWFASPRAVQAPHS